jgi:Domain of unknown function (DUF6948)
MTDMNQHTDIAAHLIGMHVLCRTYSAGVFAGTLVSRQGREVLLADARRIWHWKGAASLSELANRGTSCPAECKFPAPVAEVFLTEAIELIPLTEEARATLDAVPLWSA